MTDREKLIELIEKGASEWWKENKDTAFRSGETNTDYIADYLISKGVTIPVRCSECKHYEAHTKNNFFCGRTEEYSEVITNWVKPNDFCSYGERRNYDYDNNQIK